MGKSKILIFDSGVGGLTLLHDAKGRFPREHYIYYTDSGNMPYGDLTKEEVLRHISQCIEVISQYKLKAVVISCHTIDVIGADLIQARLNVPVVRAGAVKKPASREFDPRKILILGTPLMLDNIDVNVLIKGLTKTDVVEKLSIQELVNFAEEFDFDSPQLRRYMKSLSKRILTEDYHTIVMACSHGNYYARHIRELIPSSIDVVNCHLDQLNRLNSVLLSNPNHSDYHLDCILSGMKVSNEVLSPYLNYLKDKSFFPIGNNYNW